MTRDLNTALHAVVAGFTEDPGISDLDDEQTIHVRMTLGDWRRIKWTTIDKRDGILKVEKLRCPECGAEDVKDYGSVFVEDGPWDGKMYRNEHDAARYMCGACRSSFALVEAPILCAECGERVTGELGEECEETEYGEKYFCGECVKKAEAEE